MKPLFAILSLGLLATSCASLQSVSLSSIPEKRDKRVHAEVSKFVFLGFNFSNDYANELPEKLREQCPNGKVQGILTKQMTKSYVLFFDYQLEATGYCTQEDHK